MKITKKNAFYGAVVVQVVILIYLIIPTDKNLSIVDFARASLAWFFNNNEDTNIVLPNTTHVCIPMKPTLKHKPGDIFLMVLVMSKALNEEAREVIRNTWGDKKQSAKEIVTVIFITGCTPSIHLDRDVDKETSKYHDILRVGSKEEKDRYEMKRLWFGYQWVMKQKPKFVIKTYNHVYIHLPRFVHWLKDAKTPNKLYAGKVHSHVAVNRNPKKPFFVSDKQFSPTNFPDYCSGTFYAFSGKLLKNLVELEKKIPKFDVEDAYFGVLMRKLEVEPMDIDNKLHIEGQLGNDVQSWTNKMFNDFLVIGMNLQPGAIQYIYDRYKSIESGKAT